MLRAKDMKSFVDQVAGLPLANQPGARWYYSIAYDLQGVIIERITGKKFGDYLEENLFKPMGMNDTGFWLTEADRPRLVTAYTRNATTGVLEAYKDADNFLSEDPFKKNSHFESGGGGASAGSQPCTIWSASPRCSPTRVRSAPSASSTRNRRLHD